MNELTKRADAAILPVVGGISLRTWATNIATGNTGSGH